LKLRNLGGHGLENTLLVHVGSSLVHGVDTEEIVVFGDLLLLEVGDVFNWVVAGVLSEGHGDLLKSVSVCAHGVLLNSLDFIGLLGDLDRAAHLSGTTATDDVGVLDHVTDDADGVMEAAAGLVADGLGTTTDEDSHGLGLGALLDQDDLVSTGSEGDFGDGSGVSELLG